MRKRNKRQTGTERSPPGGELREADAFRLNPPYILAEHSAAEAWLPNQDRRESALALRLAAISKSGTDQGHSP